MFNLLITLLPQMNSVTMTKNTFPIKITLLFLFLASFNLTAQTTLLSEDFNAGIPSGWLIINNDGLPMSSNPAVSFVTDAFVIRDNPDNPNNGDSLLMTSSWHATTGGQADDFLILPQLTLGAFGNYVYFDARSFDLTHPEGLEILVSNTGTAIEDFAVLDTAYSNIVMSPYWTTYQVSLDSIGVQNQTVYIAFRHFGSDQYLLALDNISVEMENPVTIEEVAAMNVEVYPNPTSDILYINQMEEPFSFVVYNLLGESVISGVGNQQIDLSAITKGIYTLHIEGYLPKKIIKL
jgi:hypothetical protein